MLRYVRRAVLVLPVLIALAVAGQTSADSAPALVYGEVSLFGEPFKGSAKVVAMVGTTICGTGDVKSGSYSVLVQAKCGPGNTPIDFKLQFAAASRNSAEDAYLTIVPPLPFPGTGDWLKYDLGFPRTAPHPIALAEGCAEISSTFANKTPVATVMATINTAPVSSIWKWDAKKAVWLGYIPNGEEAPLLATLKDISRGETFIACYATSDAMMEFALPVPPVTSTVTPATAGR
jgi:hypothetical protein